MDEHELAARCGAPEATRSRGRWSSRWRSRVLVLAATAAAAVGLAACGGGAGSAGVAKLGTTTTTRGASTPSKAAKGASSTASLHTDAIEFSKCMRSHGEPNFPDPSPGGGFVFSVSGSSGLPDPNSPAFQAAQHACQKYMPQTKETPASSAKDKAQLLRYANCMRAHGVTDFPDPVSRPGGGWGFNFTDTTLDPQSATYQAAVQACQKLLGGQGGGPCTNGGSRRSEHQERRC